MNLPIRPDLSLIQQPQLHLSPRLQQSILILEMSIMELRDFINKELEENLLLEEAPNSLMEQDLERVGEEPGEDWPNKAQAIEPDLYSHLRFQLQLHASNEEELVIGEEIIGNINADGYLKCPIEEIASRLKVPLSQTEEVLKAIQSFEPTGVAARDLRECLLIQLQENENSSPLAQEIVRNHLEQLLRRSQWKKLAQELKCDLKDLNRALQEIRVLEPKPGRLFLSVAPSYIIPDLVARKEGDEFRVYLNDSYLPRLTISYSYQELLNDPEAGRFLRKKLSSARWIITCIEKRFQTLEKVAGFLVKKQEDFFRNGETFLRPLSLKEVGSALGLHDSTVSRTIRGKYIDTPLGVYPLKFFITGGSPRKEARFSERKIKGEIKKLIMIEDKGAPLSDEEIAATLKNKGIVLARRTVTKYRQELGIPSKSQRKD